MGLSDLPAEAPRRIKPHEWERYNPGWVEVSLPGHGFVPHPDHQRYKVTYLWVLKPPRRLIVGIEASNVDALRGFLALYGIRSLSHESLTAMLGLGHPSLSAQFEAAGLPHHDTVDRTYAQAYCGGELVFDAGAWTVNNHSGRHSSGKCDVTGRQLDAADWKRCLTEVAEQLSACLGIAVKLGAVK